MNTLQFVLRSSNLNNTSRAINYYLIKKLYSSKSDKSDGSQSSDDEKPVTKQNEKAINKLNLLLKQMVEDDTKTKLNLARPKSNKVNNKIDANTESVQTKSVEQKIVAAAKDVANTIGGNTNKTESELLSKLLNPINSKTEDQNISSTLSDIVKGMKIDRDTKATEAVSRASQIKQILHQTRTHQKETSNVRQQRKQIRPYEENRAYLETVDIFGVEPLGIFTAPIESYEVKENETWQSLEERELRLAITHPPSNYFQEMILWTEQGKIWQFPIDNEQGMDEEKNIYFADHIFLEKHLEPWCPHKGPVRHFMELVCVGLSKNPYLSVQEKKEHIEWFKNYFEDKMQLLKDVGAIPLPKDAVKELQAE